MSLLVLFFCAAVCFVMASDTLDKSFNLKFVLFAALFAITSIVCAYKFSQSVAHMSLWVPFGYTMLCLTAGLAIKFGMKRFMILKRLEAVSVFCFIVACFWGGYCVSEIVIDIQHPKFELKKSIREAVIKPMATPSTSTAQLKLNSEDQVEGKQRVSQDNIFNAAAFGTPEDVARLLKNGVDINSLSVEGWTPLMAATLSNESAEMFETLINAGADIDEQNYDGETALLIAARVDNTNAIDMLLKHGADVKPKDKDGMTVLMHAVKKKNMKAIKAFVKAGVKINEKDNKGMTALMFAADEDNLEVIKAHTKANANSKDKKKEITLMYVESEKHTEMVETLINAGADVNAKDEKGWTALMFAAKFPNSLAIIKALVNASADVNAKDKNDWTALMVAAMLDNANVIHTLVQYGVDMNAMDKDGKTALTHAIEHNATEVVKLLRKRQERLSAYKQACEFYRAMLSEELKQSD